MNKIIKILFVIFVSSMLVSCQNAPQGEELSQEDFKGDLEYLLEVIENNTNYLYYEDVILLKNRYYEKVVSVENVGQFYHLCNLLFSELEYRGHLNAIGPSQLSYIKLQYEGLIDDEFYSNHPNLMTINNDEVKSNYLKLNTFLNEKVFTSIEFDDKYYDDNIELNIEEYYLMIKINSFNNRFIDGDISRIEAFIQDNIEYDTIVIDIRSNPGGSTSYWKALVDLTSSNVNSYQVTGYAKGEKAKEYINYYYRNNRIIVNDNELESFSSQELTFDGEKAIKDYNVFILSDERVASAAELFIDYANKNNYAKTIGTSLPNAVGVIEPMIIALPKSKLLVQMDVTKLNSIIAPMVIVDDSGKTDSYLKEIELIKRLNCQSE